MGNTAVSPPHAYSMDIRGPRGMPAVSALNPDDSFDCSGGRVGTAVTNESEIRRKEAKEHPPCILDGARPLSKSKKHRRPIPNDANSNKKATIAKDRLRVRNIVNGI